MNLFTLSNSQSWTPGMDTGQSSLTPNPACSPPLTPLWLILLFTFPLCQAYSQDVFFFQERMDQILEECEGCIGIANDITVHGHTEAKHEVCLWKLMEVAWKYGLVFNPKQTQVKAPLVKFFGCLYDESGVHLDPQKVDVAHVLPTPTNITELQKFLDLSPSFLICPP